MLRVGVGVYQSEDVPTYQKIRVSLMKLLYIEIRSLSRKYVHLSHVCIVNDTFENLKRSTSKGVITGQKYTNVSVNIWIRYQSNCKLILLQRYRIVAA